MLDIHPFFYNNVLYYADQYSTEALICAYHVDYATTHCATITGEKKASSIIPVEGSNNKFLVTTEKSLNEVEWDGKSKTACVSKKIFSTSLSDPNYMDTATVDPTGRVYFGTYGGEICGAAANSSLYSYLPCEGVREVYTGFKSCFGIAFNPNTKKAYFMDTCAFSIYELDWCPTTGQLTNRRLVYNFKVIPGEPTYLPFGLTIDSQNRLLVGSYGGGRLLIITLGKDCTCTSEKTMKLPTKFGGCPTFGGKNNTDIYITSCALLLDVYTGKSVDCETSENELDGSLFKIQQKKYQGFASCGARL